MAEVGEESPEWTGDDGTEFVPSELRGYADVASALALVAQASAVREEISGALGIYGATPPDLYQLFVKELPPFASIYLSSDGNIGGERHSVIAGFYAALEVPTPSDPDHLASLFSLLSEILRKQAEFAEAGKDKAEARARLASVSRARDVLVGEHLATWLPPYLLRAREVASYRLSGWTISAMDLLSILLEDVQVPTLEDGEVEFTGFGSSSDVINWITTPSLSGLIVTASDISRISEDLGIALRIGRKRFVLEELFGQAQQEVTTRFVAVSDHQEKLYNSHKEMFPSLGVWADKAAKTKELLSSAIEPTTE